MKNKLKQLEEDWKRALADYQNLVKRVEGERKDFVKFANKSLIMKLLPTLDILEMAANHSQDPGVNMAVSQFKQVLSDEGLQEIAPKLGEEFNPVYHECIENIPGEAKNTIAELLNKGYKMNDDFVIKPARVKVYV